MNKEDISLWVIAIGIIILFVFWTSNCTVSQNFGDVTCSNCCIRHELSGDNNGIKYFSCPDCGAISYLILGGM